MTKLSSARKALFMTHLAVGDYLYQRTFLKQIKSLYPQLQLDIWFDDFRLQRKSWHQGRSSLLSDWLKNEPFLANTFAQSTSEEHRSLQVARAQEEQYDVVFFIATTRGETFSRYARKIAGNAAWCAGVVSAQKWRWLNHIRYRHCDEHFVLDLGDSPQPILQQYQSMFSHFAPLPDVTHIEPLAIERDRIEEIEATFRKWHQYHQTRHVLLVNGVSTSAKRDYPDEKLALVLAELAVARPGTLLVINTPSHHFDSTMQLATQLQTNKQVPCEVFTATRGVSELAAVVATADGVLSVETAIIHFAAVTNTPFIALMRQKTAYWCPPQRRHAIFSDGHVSDISPTAVTQACLEFLL